MTKNTYNPYEIMMDKYDKEEMLSDVREAMLYQLGVDVSCEELNHFFTGKGKAALSGCAEWQQCFAVEKMLEFYYMHARVRCSPSRWGRRTKRGSAARWPMRSA